MQYQLPPDILKSLATLYKSKNGMGTDDNAIPTSVSGI
jgi:hypothetical protein